MALPAAFVFTQNKPEIQGKVNLSVPFLRARFVETLTKKVSAMKNVNLYFVSMLFSFFIFSACQDEQRLPEPQEGLPAVSDISIAEAQLQWVEDGLLALDMDLSVIPGSQAPQGSFSVRAYAEGRLVYEGAINLTGIPSGVCCERGECEAVEGFTYTCDAYCDNSSRRDGCNYHHQKQVFLSSDEVVGAISLVVNEGGDIHETDDAARSNNSLQLEVPPSPFGFSPENPANLYDEVGRWHNEHLEKLVLRIAEPPFVALLPHEQQKLVLEWAMIEAVAIDIEATAFPIGPFLYAYTGSEGGLMRETDWYDFKPALERLELSPGDRHKLEALYALLLEHPLEGPADIGHLLSAIRSLEGQWLDSQDANRAPIPFIAASVARHSAYFWAARQPEPFQGPQLFGIREGFFADAFGGGMGAAVGMIGGPKGAIIGGLIGGVSSSVVFAIE